MMDRILKILGKLKKVQASESGSAMVEYLLVLSLIAFGVTVGEKGVATGVNKAYSNVALNFSSALSHNTGGTGGGGGDTGGGDSGGTGHHPGGGGPRR